MAQFYTALAMVKIGSVTQQTWSEDYGDMVWETMTRVTMGHAMCKSPKQAAKKASSVKHAKNTIFVSVSK